MLQSKGNIEVTDQQLRVTLAPQSAPHRTRALAALCEELNVLDATFPGSNLCMRFSVAAKQTTRTEEAPQKATVPRSDRGGPSAAEMSILSI